MLVDGDGGPPPLPARRRRVPRRLHPAAATGGAGLAPRRRPGARRAPMGVLDPHVRVSVRRRTGHRAQIDGRRASGLRQHALALRLMSNEQ